MRKTLFVLLAAALVASLASSVMAATWYKVGTSAFIGDPANNRDHQRMPINSIAVDESGNVFATASRFNNEGTNSGGLTIFKPNGSKIDVDLNAMGLQGEITKLVKAGDGAIYGVQNYIQIHWNYDSGIDTRILKIGADGSVSVVYNGGNNGAWNAPKYRINGLTVGGDGNLYFTRAGFDSYYKYHYLWRYDVSTGSVEEAPINASNNGWSETHRMLDFEYTGNDVFTVVKMGNQEWRADPIGWTTNRVAGDVSNPGWGRDWCTATAYDPINKRLWVGARGGTNRLILSRWTDTNGDGIMDADDVWHALDTDVDMGATWFTSALACDPLNGDAWMGFNINSPTNTLAGYRGHVIRRDGALGMFDEGAPEIDDFGMASDIAALGFMPNGTALAMVLSPTGTYTLYSTAPVPEPGSLLALGTGLIGLLGIIRRRK